MAKNVRNSWTVITVPKGTGAREVATGPRTADGWSDVEMRVREYGGIGRTSFWMAQFIDENGFVVVRLGKTVRDDTGECWYTTLHEEQFIR